MVKSMWRKHQSIFQDHVNYTYNGSMNPFRVVIIQHAERIREMHNLAKSLPLPSMKGDEYNQADWDVWYKELSEDEICVTTKEGITTSMNDEMGDKDKDYNYFTHE